MTLSLSEKLRNAATVYADHHPDAYISEEARALLVLAADAIDAQTWRSMESAPKDGTVIALWNPRQPEIVRWARWGSASNGKNTDRQWVSNGRNVLTNLPTHWMPLPQPPATGDR